MYRYERYDNNTINNLQLSFLKVTIKFNWFFARVKGQQSSHTSHIIQELRYPLLSLVRWLFPANENGNVDAFHGWRKAFLYSILASNQALQ